MTRETSEQSKGHLAPRLVAVGLLLVGLLLALRFGPLLARRVGLTIPTGLQTWTGSLRPLQPIEDAAARLLARTLAEPPPPGEVITPKIRYEHPWSQWLFLVVALGGIALIVTLYRREASAPPWARTLLTVLRSGLLLLAMLFLAEAVLTLDRTGLPTFVVLIDDSASGQVVDAYAEPTTEARAASLAAVSGREKSDRLAVGLGWLLQDDARFLRDLAAQQRVRIYRVSDAAVELAEIERPDQVAPALERLKALEPGGQQSRLGEGVRLVLRDLSGSPPTALLLLTDGQTTDGASLTEAADIARKDGVPLFTIGLGDETPPRDLALSDLQVDDVVFVGDAVRFVARLSARGLKAAGSGGQATLRLSRRSPGSQGEWEPLETIQVPLPPEGENQRVEVVHKPIEVGSTTYLLEVEPQPRELQTENNRIERIVEVRDQKLRVLYVEGEPRWEFRYLKTYLERDNTIDLKTVLQLSDDRYAEQDRSALAVFPPGDDSEGGLFRYDVVILGDVDPSLLNSQQMEDIAEFVTKKGGGLLLIAGELFNPLAFKGKPLEVLLPIRLDDARNPSSLGIPIEPFQPQLTPEGLASPLFRLGDDEASSREIWAKLPPSMWYFEAPRKQPAAVVLAEHPTQLGVDGKLPILIAQYAGSGKVLFSAIDDTWRWRLRTGDRYFGRYWVQTLRYLASSRRAGQREAELIADRRRYIRGQTTQVRLRFLNPSLAQDLTTVKVELRRDNQPPRTIDLRAVAGSAGAPVFEASLTELTEGRYTLAYLPPPVLAGDPPTATFQVDPPAGEFVRLELNREELTAASRLTQGHFFRWDETSKIVADFTDAVTAETNSAAAVVVDDEEGTGGEIEPAASTNATARTLQELLPVPQQVPLDSDPPIPLWNSWPLFLLFLLLIAVEWVVRKRLRMT